MKRKYILIGIVTGLATIAGIFLWPIVKPSDTAHAFSDNYRELKIGMTKDGVRDLFGSDPSLTFSFKSSVIWLYYSHANFSSELDGSLFSGVNELQSLEDLPNAYGYVQLAFDARDLLFAYCWVGESLSITTAGDAIEGSELSKMDDSFF